MIRTQIQLTNEQARALKQLAAKEGKSVAELIRVSVDDNGKGFDPEVIRSGNSLGLKLIQERTEMLGGSFEIDSSVGKGARIVFSVPAPPASARATSSSLSCWSVLLRLKPYALPLHRASRPRLPLTKQNCARACSRHWAARMTNACGRK